LAAEAADGSQDPTWDLEPEGDGGESSGRAQQSEEEPYNPDFDVVERVIAFEPQEDDLPPRYLVKWRSLPCAPQA
jgi:hypothetical protein